ncbi:MAG: phenylacetate--CoA ligase family protein [Proteobacteria bacterium]|nr:phenylacetate--CoA ligase family protein [Pseudomonadota bacterium]
MSVQRMIMSNRTLTRAFMSSMPASFWKRQGRKNAMRVFRLAARSVPAYRSLLENGNINPADIRDFEDFQRLPILEKSTYIATHDLRELVLNGTLAGKYTVETSARTTGGSFFWPRLAEEDALFPKYIEFSFVQFYHIDQKATLIILTLGLGTWTSGEKMAQALRMTASSKRYPLTVVTPGPDLEEVLEIVQALSSHYQQTVIVGYPPFVKNVIDEGIRRGVNWATLGARIGLGGEGYSEEWREHMASKIALPENDLLGISGGYGAADLGMSVGREYPISVLIRKLAHRDEKLAEALFGQPHGLPCLMQYNPAAFFIEEVNGELVFTVKAGIPLVRYNIHDRGGVIPFGRAMDILREHGYNVLPLLRKYGYSRSDVWQLPFFYVFGRSDGTVSVEGANLYPENIEAALHTPEGACINGFRLSLQVDEDLNQHPWVLLELSRDAGSPTDAEKGQIASRLKYVILAKLVETNRDFREAHYENPTSTEPVVTVFAHGEGPFADERTRLKRRYTHDPSG